MDTGQPPRIATVNLNRVFKEWKKAIEMRSEAKRSSEERKLEMERREKELKSGPYKGRDAMALQEWRKAQALEQHQISAERREALVDEIKRVIKAEAEKKGVTLVLDSAKNTNYGTSVVLFAVDSADLTGDILEILNAPSSDA